MENLRTRCEAFFGLHFSKRNRRRDQSFGRLNFCSFWLYFLNHFVKVEVGPTGKGEIFNATGLRVEDPGYLLVYPWEKWADKTMPLYRVNQQLKNFVVSLVNGRTEPPKLLTEADLIGLMDKFGIGTDATHSDHIEKVKNQSFFCQ